MSKQDMLYEQWHGEQWVCIRPDKRYTRFRLSLQEPGFHRLAGLLGLDAQMVKVRLDEAGRIWASGIPSVPSLVAFALENPARLLALAEEREQVFSRIREHAMRLYDRLAHGVDDRDLPSVVGAEVLQWRVFHDAVFHLILLNALIVDEIGGMFFDLLVARVGNRLALEHTTQLFRTPYAVESRRNGRAFHKHTDLHSHVDEVIPPAAETDLNPVSEFEGQVSNVLLSLPLGVRGAAWEQYSCLRLVAPLLVQLNDEQAYLWRAHGRLIMRLVKLYEAKERQTNPSYSVSEMAVNEVLARLPGQS